MWLHNTIWPCASNLKGISKLLQDTVASAQWVLVSEVNLLAPTGLFDGHIGVGLAAYPALKMDIKKRDKAA